MHECSGDAYLPNQATSFKYTIKGSGVQVFYTILIHTMAG